MDKLLYASAFLGLLYGTFVFANEVELKVQIERLKQQSEYQASQIQHLQTQTSTLVQRQSNMAPSSTDTTIGGYGEIGFNRYSEDTSRNEADLKRFVLFFGHRFTDQLSFNSEVEWEHAVTSATDKGESEIEQAYMNYQFDHGLNLKAGLILIPFGFLNQSHEPPVFYGVERNEVETRIIPSTWREGGLGLSGATAFDLNWDLGITTGFDLAKFDDPSAPLSSVHQELQFAKAHDPSYFGALNFRAIPGFVVGGALFTGNSSQGNADFNADKTKPDFAGIDARVTLWDVHSRWQQNGWDLQALYAQGSIGDADRIDRALAAFNTATSGTRQFVPSEFYGWLAQAAYTVWRSGDMTVTPFARYEIFNTQFKMPPGFISDSANADRVATVGLSFKPHPQVVCKIDYQKFIDHGNKDRLNLGLGYMF